MGVQKYYSELLGKWVLKGRRIERHYDTEEEADADRPNVNKVHWDNIRAFQIVANMLVQYRYM